MISAESFFAASSHAASQHDLELIWQLDLKGAPQTSICFRVIGFSVLSSSPTDEDLSSLDLPSSSTVGASLPAATSARLLELDRLGPDWDSYGALAPSSRAVAAAGALIGRVHARAGDVGVPHEIMPIADGGISLEWRYPGIELSLNACPDGGWTYLVVRRDELGRHFTEGYDLSDDDALALVFQTMGAATR